MIVEFIYHIAMILLMLFFVIFFMNIEIEHFKHTKILYNKYKPDIINYLLIISEIAGIVLNVIKLVRMFNK